MFKKFNKWYDGLQEPKRFFLFFGYTALAILLCECHVFWLVAIGAIMLTVETAVALSRI